MQPSGRIWDPHLPGCALLRVIPSEHPLLFCRKLVDGSHGRARTGACDFLQLDQRFFDAVSDFRNAGRHGFAFKKAPPSPVPGSETLKPSETLKSVGSLQHTETLKTAETLRTLKTSHSQTASLTSSLLPLISPSSSSLPSSLESTDKLPYSEREGEEIKALAESLEKNLRTFGGGFKEEGEEGEPLRRRNLSEWKPLFRVLPPKRDVSSRKRRLQRALQRYVAAQDRNMRVGVHVIHLVSGEETGIRKERPFPLASVAKVPIMVEALKQLQHSEEVGGELSLDTPIIIKEREKCIGSGRLWKYPRGTKIKFGECLELMQTISDNTAADLVLRVVKMEKVRQRMKDLKLDGIDIHLSQRQAYLVALGQAPQLNRMSSRKLADTWKMLGVKERTAVAREAEKVNKSLRISDLFQMEGRSEENQKMAGSRKYREDRAVAMAVDNMGRPADVARMFAQLAKGQLLSPHWTDHCMGILSRQQYGQRRLPKCLPKGTPVYHKTGSITGVINAAGVVEVEQGGGMNRVAIAALVDNVRRFHEREAEAVIARISRMVYDAYRPGARWRAKYS